MKPGLLIFTDLDGSLLDHFNYSHQAADDLLASLEKAGIPVIPCTSKTARELKTLRKELNNTHPFIAENGAAVFIPEHYFGSQPEGCQQRDGFWVKEFCQPREHWIYLVDKLRPMFKGDYQGFAESSIDEIMAMTGLSREAAKAASQREFGEPLKWLGSDLQRSLFIATVQAAGAQVLAGGRFLHVTGRTDKGRALDWLTSQYARRTGKHWLTLAIGDSDNDRAMLETADQALIVRSPVHDPPNLHRKKKAHITEQTGPVGWAEGVAMILRSLEIKLGH